MIKNYLKTAIRNLVNNKVYSVINIIGLSIGLACSILVLLYLKNELTYDSMHINKKSIYRVGFNISMPESSDRVAVITSAVAPSLLEEFPEVESMVRVRQPRAGFFSKDGVIYNAENMCFADSTFFDIFSFKLISGSVKSVLTEPYSAVLTKSLAKKIFGNEDPIGKVLNYNNSYSVVVKGIAEDCPDNSSVQYSAIISFTTLYNQPNIYLGWNGGNQYYNYIKLKPSASIETIIPKLPDFLEKHINYRYRQSGWLVDLIFDRLDRMHLHSDVSYEPNQGSIKRMWEIGLVGFLVLLIAVFNFMNLTTARSSQRSVEIGIRKVMGAYRSMIKWQFLGEAIVFSLISFLVSLILIEIFQPQFTRYIGDYELYTASNTGFIISVILFTVLIGVIAGIYPAFVIARFNPIKSLKGELAGGGTPYLRNTLVVTQFVISTIIITYTLVMLLQFLFIRQKDLGFDTNNTLLVKMTSRQAIKAYPVLKTEFMLLPDVNQVSSSSEIIGRGTTRNGYRMMGEKEPRLYNFFSADEGFLKMLQLEIVKGRDFSSAILSDDSAYIINEAMADELNWEDPIGKKISRNGVFHVIGVVKNFHFDKVQKKIAPVIIGLSNANEHDFVYIKLNNNNYFQSIQLIEKVWHEVLPDEPFQYYVYQNVLKNNYTELKKTIVIMGLFALITIFIACMGLYGLAMFTVERRHREIGVRKVFGAGAMQIARLVVIDFLKWILIADIISIPVAYYYSVKFLDGFAYAIRLDVLPFLIAFILSVIIALVTIVFQVMKLSRVNPVSTLKYE